MSSLRARLGAVDPLLGVVGLVSFLVYLGHGFNALLGRDLGLYTYGGQRFLAGDPPYVGVLNRAGPLAHILPGVGIGLGRLVGVSDVHAARGFFLLLAVACVCGVYVVIRDLTSSRGAAVLGAVALLTFQGFTDLASNGPREKTAMVLFLLVSLWSIVHRHWATCGVFLALATLTWQPVFAVGLVAAVVAVLLAPDRRWMALLRIAVGGAVTTAVVMLYYLVEGDLHTFLEGFVLINAQYTRQTDAVSNVSTTWTSLSHGYGPSIWVIAIGLVALPIVAAASARTAWRTREAAPVALVAIAAGWLAGVVWTARVYNGWPDLFVLLPLAAIGIGIGASTLLRGFEARVAVPVMLVLALVGTTYATVYSVTNRYDELPAQRASVAAILRTGPHPATMLSIQAPEALVLAHRVNPSPYQMFDNGFATYVDDHYPGGLAGYVSWIAEQDPTYIVMQPGLQNGLTWLGPWLKQHYQMVGQAPQLAWWVNKSVPPDQRRRMKRANAVAVERAGA